MDKQSQRNIAVYYLVVQLHKTRPNQENRPTPNDQKRILTIVLNTIQLSG